jgi:hypothetical protein
MAARGEWNRFEWRRSNPGNVSALDDPVPHAPLDWMMRPYRAATKGHKARLM